MDDKDKDVKNYPVYIFQTATTGCEPVTWTSSRIKTESTSVSHHLHHHHHDGADSAAAVAPAATVGVTEVDAVATNGGGGVDPSTQTPAAVALTAVGTAANGGTTGKQPHVCCTFPQKYSSKI